MRRIKIDYYLDVIVTHPENSPEDLEKYIQEEKEKSSELTEWPEIY